MNTTLKLGSETGSLVNHIYSGMKDVKPEVGMGATLLFWSDRHAATVVEVSDDGKRIAVVEDIATRIDNNGMSEAQEYKFEQNPNGHKVYFTLRKNGSYVQEGQSMKEGQRVKVGMREQYYDFSF